VALILYALLPVIRMTAAGLRSIDPAILEAADALGMTARQRLFQVELPLGFPSIIAGIRVAAVVGVGTVTIAAAIGAGGLGEYIYRGLSMVDATVILAGAIPAALLAIAVDLTLLAVERVSMARSRRRPVRTVLVTGLALVGLVGVAWMAWPSEDRIVVGSKNFTEQVILGELVAQSIERYAGLPVDRRFNLGGTFICDQAIRSGDIDIYVEYSGTALTAVFNQAVERDSAIVLEDVREQYADVGVTLLDPLGFENTYAILLRGDDALARGLTRLSELSAHAPEMRLAVGYEFLERQDGYSGLVAAYSLDFREAPRAMDTNLTYRALAGGQVDVIQGDSTAGLIQALGLVQLDDDRQYFPPYDAVPVVHATTLLQYPEVRDALARLTGRVTLSEMRRMNYAVAGEQRIPADVVREFLDVLDRGV
jgi:osmoprotectant transport system permease protein